MSTFESDFYLLNTNCNLWQTCQSQTVDHTCTEYLCTLSWIIITIHTDNGTTCHFSWSRSWQKSQNLLSRFVFIIVAAMHQVTPNRLAFHYMYFRFVGNVFPWERLRVSDLLGISGGSWHRPQTVHRWQFHARFHVCNLKIWLVRSR